ncbi:PEP-CTERM sorting domain-containing protein [Herbaspirillum lusitanum]|uniref:PEP-CTERM sorting domain-containing protein n=1 Tax=Herbaspirillum lusitanum TaxID=213312 RepID=A0ABW9A8X7_9BURK
MNIKKTLFSALACLLLITGSAYASVVKFTENNNRSDSFADGTFSKNLSHTYGDGFYANNSTQAFNGYGQNGEFILFNSAVQLISLQLADWQYITSTTVSLYDAAQNLLGSQTVASNTLQTLTFNTNNVTKLVFTFTGGTPNLYGDGRLVGWFIVDNITYGPNQSVPEPAGIALLGLGLAAMYLRRKKMI